MKAPKFTIAESKLLLHLVKAHQNTPIKTMDHHEGYDNLEVKLKELIASVYEEVKKEELDCDHDYKSVFHRNSVVGWYCTKCNELEK